MSPGPLTWVIPELSLPLFLSSTQLNQQREAHNLLALGQTAIRLESQVQARLYRTRRLLPLLILLPQLEKESLESIHLLDHYCPYQSFIQPDGFDERTPSRNE